MKRFFAKSGIWLGVTALACLVILVCLCFSDQTAFAKTQYYTIYKENGQWLMEFYPERWGGQKIEYKYTDRARTVPLFSSLSDMRRKLKYGKIDPFYLSSIHNDQDGDVQTICNLDDLQELKAPKGMDYDYIAFGGDGYNFWFRNSQINGFIACANQSRYEWSWKEYYTGFATGRQILPDAAVADRDARVIESILDAYVRKDILYSIQSGEQTFYIREEYLTKCITDSPYTAPLSETVPYKIYVFGNNGIHYFHGQLEGFEERPSVQWLSSFGLKPHSEGKNALIGLSIGVLVAGVILAVGGYLENRRRKLISDHQTV